MKILHEINKLIPLNETRNKPRRHFKAVQDTNNFRVTIIRLEKLREQKFFNKVGTDEIKQ